MKLIKLEQKAIEVGKRMVYLTTDFERCAEEV